MYVHFHEESQYVNRLLYNTCLMTITITTTEIVCCFCSRLGQPCSTPLATCQNLHVAGSSRVLMSEVWELFSVRSC